ncbi:recombination regulator RecX [Lampropedia puyangensis]|uniref:Regulatory protein RecX n=1 Tax=Lampropedia puyangensis TaxID=1330072 RepID=A0A4S8F3H9_9BURK|nr:recombination regulator RecX [Lampropedia puyangensis]THU01519.1 recombination regulator RecX [Lampropedia puyangensis]
MVRTPKTWAPGGPIPLSDFLNDHQPEESPTLQASISENTALPPKANTPNPRKEPSLAARALRTLSRREYTRVELQRKLRVWAESPEALEQVLDAMQSKGFLSDARAAESMARQKSARLGTARIQQALIAKGVSKELVDATIAPLQESEWQRAQDLWESKFGHLTDEPLEWQEKQKRQAKQIRFMTSRGFSLEIIRKLMKNKAQE